MPAPSVKPAPLPDVPVITAAQGGGRRIALIIGNSADAHAGALKNPANDAKTIAGAMRRIGFTEVIDRYDLGLAEMTAALKDFGTARPTPTGP